MKRIFTAALAAILIAFSASAQTFTVRPGWEPDTGVLPAIGVGYWEAWEASGTMSELQGLFISGAFRGLQLNVGFENGFKPDHILAGPTFFGILDLGSSRVLFPFGPLFGVCRMGSDGKFDYGGSFGVVWGERIRPGLVCTATRGTWGVSIVVTF